MSNIKEPYYDSDEKIIAYCVDISNKDNGDPVGYAIVGSTYDMPAIIEVGKGLSPHTNIDNIKDKIYSSLSTDESISEVKIIYGGPLTYIYKAKTNKSNIENKLQLYDKKFNKVKDDKSLLKALKKPQLSNQDKIKMNNSWKNLTENKNITESNNEISLVSSTAPTPGDVPYSYWKTIGYGLLMEDIQEATGSIESYYACGPASGSQQLWFLGTNKPNSYGTLTANQTAVSIAEELVHEMNAFGGTMVNEYVSGIRYYGTARNISLPIAYKHWGVTNSIGIPNTTLPTDVWTTLKTGVTTYKAPVSLGIGRLRDIGAIYYPRTEPWIPEGDYMEFHWVTVNGYAEYYSDRYVSFKTWGEVCRASFDSLLMWRDSLASVYIQQFYY